MTGTIHTDLQAKISLCRAQREDHVQSNDVYSIFLLLIYCLYIICAQDYSQTVINQSIRICCMQFMLVADQVLCNPVPCQMHFHINTDYFYFLKLYFIHFHFGCSLQPFFFFFFQLRLGQLLLPRQYIYFLNDSV